MEVIISNEKHLSMFNLDDTELTVFKGKNVLFSEPMVGDTIKIYKQVCFPFYIRSVIGVGETVQVGKDICVYGVIVATRDTNYECESKDWKKYFKRLKNQPK